MAIQIQRQIPYVFAFFLFAVITFEVWLVAVIPFFYLFSPSKPHDFGYFFASVQQHHILGNYHFPEKVSLLLDCCFVELTFTSGMTYSHDGGPASRFPSSSIELFCHGGCLFRPVILANVNIHGAPLLFVIVGSKIGCDCPHPVIDTGKVGLEESRGTCDLFLLISCFICCSPLTPSSVSDVLHCSG